MADTRITKRRIRRLIDEYCDGSQQIFADRAKISKVSVSQYVNGTNAPGNHTAAKIAFAFDVDPMWVMGFEVKEPVFRKSIRATMTVDEEILVSEYRTADAMTKEMVKRILRYNEKMSK